MSPERQLTLSSAAERPSLRAVTERASSQRGLIYTTYVNRKIALLFTFLFWRLGVSPNQVTVLGFALTFSGLACVVLPARQTVGSALAAWSLLALGYVLDSSDGQLARITNTQSRFGEWLDHLGDMVKLLALNLSLGVALLRAADDTGLDSTAIFAVVALNLLAQVIYFYGWNSKTLLFGKGLYGSTFASGTAQSLLRLPLHLLDYGLFLLLLLALPATALFTRLYLVYGVMAALLCVAYLFTSVRSMRASDRVLR